MEIVTFSHFSDVHRGRSFHDVINHKTWLSDSMAAVFIDPCSLALGAEYEILVSHGRVHDTDIVQYCLTPRTHFLVAGVIKEVVSWL